MNDRLTRRDVLVNTAGAAAGAMILPTLGCASLRHRIGSRPLFTISLAEWSLHRTIRSGEMTNLDFPRVAREKFGMGAVEYVNTFFKDKANDRAYLHDLRTRCDGEGIRSLLIMCDGEGALGDPDEKARLKTVDNHRKWADAAKHLGCHSIRVNAQSKGTPEQQAGLAADGLRRLTEYCASLGLYCLVENHGGLSSHGDWLMDVMRRVDHPRVGTLPDFGNWYEYDRYKGVAEMMPLARAVSAKSHDFDENGNETRIDYERMMRIVLDAGYHGWVGIEYEGERLPEAEGILATKQLLERTRQRLGA